MTAKGESSKGEQIKRGHLPITDHTVRNLEGETEETEEITEGLKRFNSQASETGYIPGKILSCIKARDLIETSWQRHTTIMWLSTKKIKNMNFTRNISLSHGLWRDTTPVKFTFGKLYRLGYRRPKRKTLKLR